MSRCYSVHRPARSMGDAIKLFCRECQGGSEPFIDSFGKQVENHPAYNEVRDCPCENSCSLWRYRFGKNPDRKASNPKGNPEALAQHRLSGEED